jgi:hypothetical protein
VPSVTPFANFAEDWDENYEVDLDSRWDRKAHELPDKPPEWRLAQYLRPDGTAPPER